ncbi:MAG: 50S ribosomal protein L5 [Candidatus Omnitrophica bacterium]|nr:50S ribosomal protein L5 [Candidatus Omnitrophota bacterium]
MSHLKEEYSKTIVPHLMKKFSYKSTMQVPRLKKIVVNIGAGEMAHEKDLMENLREELAAITGQKPKVIKARKSISNFKIREGSLVGLKVTLRRERMYEFLDRLINFCMPRIRDFRGVPRASFDEGGNYSLGIKEQNIFPEVDLNKLKMTHGMDICIVTSAPTKEEAFALLEAFGMPFAK